MIGQEHLLNKVNNYTLSTFPKTILFLGEFGCGKKTLANYISEKFGLEIVYILDNVSPEDLINYQQDPITKIYLIDLDNFTQKQQNQFLKFIEEPSKTNYIILMSSSENLVLETIKNRCLKFNFREYTKKELKQFKYFENEDIYDICKTPGQLENISEQSFNNLVKLCETIIERISSATFANTASVSTKINYKEEYDKYDFNLFFKTLSERLKKHYINEGNKKYLDEIIYLNLFTSDSKIKTLNKENFMINFLINYKSFVNSLK